MSKAVLVLEEMPSSCDVCPFCEIYETPSGVIECNNPLSKEYGCYVSDYVGARPEGCPLRELPEKLNVKDAKTTTGFAVATTWNACIDEITRGKE